MKRSAAASGLRIGNEKKKKRKREKTFSVESVLSWPSWKTSSVHEWLRGLGVAPLHLCPAPQQRGIQSSFICAQENTHVRPGSLFCWADRNRGDVDGQNDGQTDGGRGG